MASEWRIMHDDCNMAVILAHPAGAKAWFGYSDFAKMRPYTANCGNPFIGLAYMIHLGLRPYKTEGGFDYDMLPSPVEQLPAPQKLLEAH